MGIKFNRHWFLLVFISVEIQDQFGRLYFISISYQFHSTGVFDMYVTLFRFRCNVDFTSIFCGCSSVSRLGNVNFCRSDWIGVVIFLRSYTEKINSNALFFICAYASYLIHVSTFVWIYSIPHLRVCLCVCVNVCVCVIVGRVCVFAWARVSVSVRAHDDRALACTQRRGAAAARRRLRLAGDLRGGAMRLALSWPPTPSPFY